MRAIEFSEDEITFPELLEVCTVDPVSIIFEFNPETGVAQRILLLAEEFGDESRFTSVSEMKFVFSGVFGSVQYTAPSELFELEVSTAKHFKLISDLLYYSRNCVGVIRFSF